MKTIRLFLLLPVLFFATSCASSSHDASTKPAAANLAVGPVPDLTDGKPMILGNCNHDASVAYTRLAKVPGANPRILLIWYTANGAQYGHAMCRFTWAGSVQLFDRSNGGQHLVPIPPSIKPDDASAVAAVALPTRYLAMWAQSDPF